MIAALNRLRTFASDESGATAIEYAIIASLLSITVLGAATEIGISVAELITGVNTGFTH